MPWVLEEAEKSIPQEENGWILDDEEKPNSISGSLKATARGAALGGGGYGSTLDALGLQMKEPSLPGQKIRYDIESNILEKMQDPTYKPNFEELSYLSGDDEVLPDWHRIASKQDISTMIGGNDFAKNLNQTNLERVLSGSAETVGDFVSMLPFIPSNLGIINAAKKGALFGAGAEIAGASGGGPFAQLGAGILASEYKGLAEAGINFSKKIPEYFKTVKETILEAPNYIKKLIAAKEIPTGTPKFFEEAGTSKALADIELSSKDLAGRTAKTSESEIQRFENQIGRSKNEKLSDITNFSADAIEKDIVKSTQGKILDTIAPSTKTDKLGWESIRNVVEDNFKKAKEAYSTLYDFVETQSKNIKTVPKNTYTEAKKLSKEMNETLFTASEESSVRNASDVMVAKLAQPQEGIAKNLIEDLEKEGIYADYENVLKMLQEDVQGIPREVSISTLQATKRSINRILSKSDIIPAPVDLLKKLSKALNKDIYAGLEGTPEIAKAYFDAESSFAKAQDMFNNDTIIKFRKSANPETMSSYFSSPSNKEKLNAILSGQKEVLSSADRMIVENATSKGLEQSKALSKELKPYLGRESQEAIDKIIEYGDKLTSPGQRSAIRGKVLEELQSSFVSGQRPEFTLKLMQNDKGYQLIKDSLMRSPNGRRAFKTLQRQSVEDLMQSTIKDGRIDFLKAKDILKNPMSRKLISNSMGNEGLKFFEGLETYGKNFAHNLELLEKNKPGFVTQVLDSVLTKTVGQTAAVLTAVLPGGAVIPKTVLATYVGKEGLNLIRRAKLYKILEDPEIRKTVASISQKNVSQKLFKEGIKKLSQLISQHEKTEETE